MEKKLLLTVQAIFGLEWLRHGSEKLFGAEPFTNEIAKDLAFFASKNPLGFYRDFLNGFAAAHAGLFAVMVLAGEFLGGLAMAFAALATIFGRGNSWAKTVSVVALGGVAVMNLNFWLATKWISPANDGLNLIMFAVEAVLLAGWLFAFRDQKTKASSKK